VLPRKEPPASVPPENPITAFIPPENLIIEARGPDIPQKKGRDKQARLFRRRKYRDLRMKDVPRSNGTCNGANQMPACLVERSRNAGDAQRNEKEGRE
jgi:hypothetical protein